MIVIRLSLLQHLIVQKLRNILSNDLSNVQNLPTLMKPSLVPRVPRDQGFRDPGGAHLKINKNKLGHCQNRGRGMAQCPNHLRRRKALKISPTKASQLQINFFTS